MTVPFNAIATTGTGAAAITADGFNTYVQTVATVSTLRGFTGVSGMEIELQGYSSPNDGGQGQFYWNTTTGTDDGGVTTVVPNGSTSGCWSRLGKNFVSSSIASGSAVSLTSGVPANVTSITLQPGTWLLWGNIVTAPAGSTTTSSVTASISTNSATNASTPNGGAFAAYSSSVSGGAVVALPTGFIRVSITSATAYYLVIDVGFATSTMSAYGFLGAVPSA